MDLGDIGVDELAGPAARSPSPFREGDRLAEAEDPALATPSAADSTGTTDKSDDSAVKAGETLAARIAKLKAEQNALIEQKKRTSKDLKNAERKRRRLKVKARTLSHDDLLQLLQMRSDGSAENTTGSSSSDKKPTKSSGSKSG